MDTLKISTGGSVDAGKSTLIGRLLWDTDSITDDRVAAIKKASGENQLDLSLATDGLLIERERGITIDVAHVFFGSAFRNYIIADTPGHFEYTRNMITGASTSQVSILVIGADVGTEAQTERHFFINNLLRIKDVVVVVNKMDLFDFSEEVFENMKRSFKSMLDRGEFEEQRITFIPVSALCGDNVVHRSDSMSWYKGPTLLSYLDELSVDTFGLSKARFPIQCVVQDPEADFIGYAGKLLGADLSVGCEIEVLPSLKRSRVKGIQVYEKHYGRAVKGSSILLTLEDDLKLERGDMIVKAGESPLVMTTLVGVLTWMSSTSLKTGVVYDLQHGIRRVKARVDDIINKLNPDFSQKSADDDALNMNEIGRVRISLDGQIFADPFEELTVNGSFILIDPNSNDTVAVGLINGL